VAALSIAFALRFVTVRIEREAEAQLDRGLAHAATLVEQHHATRLETLTLHAHLIADLPKLKAAVATGHPPTIEPLARDYRARVKSDLFAVRDEAGTVLVALGASPDTARHLPTVADALARGEAVAYGPGQGGVQEIVTVPIAVGPDPPEVLGTLSLGFGLDDALAREFKAATESEVAFALEGRILASTLPGEHGAALARVLAAGGASSLALGGSEYVAVVRSLGPKAGAVPAAIILRSRTERLQALRTFRAGLLAAALVGLLVAVLLSYAVARTVTRPLAAITAAMREMAQTGALTSIRLGRRGDEDARLLATTFNMLTESIARFQREAALKERLSALGRLSTVIAHEVRNPLMIVKASLRTLRRGEASPEEAREAVADIEEEVARLDRIVGDVLDFARPIRVEPASTDLNALCSDAAGRTGGLTVRLALDPGLGPVVTDAERIRTALVNVLANAREAVLASSSRGGDGGGGAVRLATSRVEGDRVAIDVEDDGVGIEAADLPHVFEPYYTTKRTGSGLGLAIAKNILDALGGTLAVQSRPGVGTRVRIEIPRGAN
jgi:signal transduction histidine kinase